jgi:hypothetical protein
MNYPGTPTLSRLYLGLREKMHLISLLFYYGFDSPD